MSNPRASGKARDGPQRQKRRLKAANGQSSETDDYHERAMLTYEPSPQNISQEDLVGFETDLAPLLHEATAMKQEIVNKLESWDDLMGDITAALQGRIHVVRGASDTWERKEEQTKKMTELEDLNKKLFLRFGDMQKQHEAEKKALELDVEKLQSEMEGLKQKFTEEYEREYHDRTTKVQEKERQMESKHRKMSKKLEVEKTELRKELESEKKNEIDSMKAKIDELETQVKTLSDHNKGKDVELGKLNSSMTLLKRAYNSLEQENVSSKANVEKLREEFRLPEQSDDYLYDPHPLVLNLIFAVLTP
jgi:chromosome segregation ATPase